MCISGFSCGMLCAPEKLGRGAAVRATWCRLQESRLSSYFFPHHPGFARTWLRPAWWMLHGPSERTILKACGATMHSTRWLCAFGWVCGTNECKPHTQCCAHALCVGLDAVAVFGRASVYGPGRLAATKQHEFKWRWVVRTCWGTQVISLCARSVEAVLLCTSQCYVDAGSSQGVLLVPGVHAGAVQAASCCSSTAGTL